MGFDQGRIVVDSDNGTYYSGQTVSGKLIFDQEKVKTFRGIYARMKGYCEVEWHTTHTRRVNDRTESYTVYHRGHEVYFESKQYLVGGESGEHQLNPGHHEFPFHFRVPAHCPSSFEGSYGHIRYEIKVVVDRAFKLDQTKMAAIRLIAPLDLNADPYCREPMEFDFDETFCCWCVSSGNCETVIKLPASGYCPGQLIPIEVSCNNNSGVEMENIVFSIEKYLEFRASDCATRDEDSTVVRLKKGPVAAHTTRNWTVEMELPALDAYNLNSCQFINLEYKFKVEIETGGCHVNSDQKRKIVIGSIPLVGFQDNYRNPLQDQMPVQAMPVVQHQPAPAPYPAVAPYPGYPSGPQYPGDNPPPYPGISPYPPQPYPGYPTTAPYPANVPTNPYANPPQGYPEPSSHFGLKDEKPGMPSIPAPMAPYPVGPFASPSAPASAPAAALAPATPDAEKLFGDGAGDRQPAYNPFSK